MKVRFDKRFTRMLRQKLRNSVLDQHGVGVLARTWNGLLVVEAGDFSVGRQLLRDGAYDRREIEWLRDCMGPGAERIVVVGTHIGSLLVPLSKSARAIHGFEPDAINFALLSHNLRLNDVRNASVVNAAVGARAGTVTLRRNTQNTGSTSVAPAGGSGGQQVPIVTLDDTVGDKVIDLMVMDVEGHEQHVVDGAKKTLARTERLYVEFAPEQLLEHGSDPRRFLASLCGHFQHLYQLGEGVSHRGAVEGCHALESQMGARGFLRNLLFTKSPLTEAALTRPQ